MLKVNEYSDGKVKSIAFQTATLPATVGAMEVGEYEFCTTKKETVTIVSGLLTVRLPGSDQWRAYPAGTTFVVAAEQKFDVRVNEESAYLCTYQ